MKREILIWETFDQTDLHELGQAASVKENRNIFSQVRVSTFLGLKIESRFIFVHVCGSLEELNSATSGETGNKNKKTWTPLFKALKLNEREWKNGNEKSQILLDAFTQCYNFAQKNKFSVQSTSGNDYSFYPLVAPFSHCWPPMAPLSHFNHHPLVSTLSSNV